MPKQNYIELFAYWEKDLWAIHSQLADNSSPKRAEICETLQNDSDVTLFLFVSPYFVEAQWGVKDRECRSQLTDMWKTLKTRNYTYVFLVSEFNLM